jgi:hypothetical protein
MINCESYQKKRNHIMEQREKLFLTSRAPPCTFFIPIMLSGSRASNDMTASTTIREKKDFCRATSFELSAVDAHLRRSSFCSLGSSFLILTAISLILFTSYKEEREVHCNGQPSEQLTR